MPGGSRYESLGPLLESIAAQVDGVPCCTYVGPGGAGHFVQTVHDGIEYADMQLIAETYDLIKQATGTSASEISQIFRTWNEGDLESFLIEITAEVLGQTDAEPGKPFVDIVLDQAEQKGTGAGPYKTLLILVCRSPASRRRPWPMPCPVRYRSGSQTGARSTRGAERVAGRSCHRSEAPT